MHWDSLWTLDLLGNWVGEAQTSTPGRRTLGVPTTTGPPYHREVSSTDTINRTNAITQRQMVDGSNTSNLNPVHDAAGNLVLDEDYFYQYDAWNRLIQVSARGTLQLSLGTGGVLAVSGQAGAWIVHYTYDGLGRLIRKQSPWPTLDPYGRAQVRTEHFYYDGVRRIQETITDPLAAAEDDAPVEIGKEAELPPLATVTLTSREYIHSPGYVDEVVAEVDVPLSGTSAPDRPAWVIQDANYNVVALVDDAGVMLHQYTWDPYGQPVQVDRYDTGINGAPAPFENRIGHQGLFFDRFDGGANNVLMQQLYVNPATGLAAKGLYQNRERTYSPSLGRFTQRDPNGAGRPLAIGGRGDGFQAPWLAVGSIYNDGMSVYGYALSRPTGVTDPLGRFGYIGGMMTGMDIADMSVDAMDQAYQGLSNFMNVFSMVSDYMFNQEQDAYWAEDWSSHDFEYSQSVVEMDYGGGGEPAGFGDGFILGEGLTAEQLAVGKPMQWHHIMTNKGSYRAKFEARLSRIGINDLDFGENKVRMPHGGRHNREYHEWVLNEIDDAINNTPGNDAAKQAAVKRRLQDIGNFLTRKDKSGRFKNASFLYNTVQGKKTKFAGKRKKIKWR